MRISEIRDPNLFQRLVRKLMIAEHGLDYQVVDDSGGDGGLDGFHRTTGDLHAFYCPEKPSTGRYRAKFRNDLEKVKLLRDEKQYPIKRFVFVTPEAMREPDQRMLRDLARQNGFNDGINMSAEYLEVLLAQNMEIVHQFPELSYPQVVQKIDHLIKVVEQMQLAEGSTSTSESAPKVTDAAAKILARAVKAANKAIEGKVEAEEIIRIFDLTKEQYRDAVEELDALGVIGVSKNVNAPGGYQRVWIGAAAFVQAAPQVLTGVDIKGELQNLLQAVGSGGGEYVSAKDILERSSVPLARAQILVDYLEQHNLVKTAGLSSYSDSLLFHYGHILPLGKRILQGKDELPL